MLLVVPTVTYFIPSHWLLILYVLCHICHVEITIKWYNSWSGLDLFLWTLFTATVYPVDFLIRPFKLCSWVAVLSAVLVCFQWAEVNHSWKCHWENLKWLLEWFLLWALWSGNLRGDYQSCDAQQTTQKCVLSYTPLCCVWECCTCSTASGTLGIITFAFISSRQHPAVQPWPSFPQALLPSAFAGLQVWIAITFQAFLF